MPGAAAPPRALAPPEPRRLGNTEKARPHPLPGIIEERVGGMVIVIIIRIVTIIMISISFAIADRSEGGGSMLIILHITLQKNNETTCWYFFM